MKKCKLLFTIVITLVFLVGCASIDNSTLLRAGTGSKGNLKNTPNRKFSEIKDGSLDKDPIFEDDEVIIKRVTPSVSSDNAKPQTEPSPGNSGSAGNSGSGKAQQNQEPKISRNAFETARNNPGREILVFVDSGADEAKEEDPAVVSNTGKNENAQRSGDKASPAPESETKSAENGSKVGANSVPSGDAQSRSDVKPETTGAEPEKRSVPENVNSTLENATAEVRRGVNTVSDVFNNLGKGSSDGATSKDDTVSPIREERSVPSAEEKAKNSNFVLIVILVAALLIGIAIAYYTVSIKKQQDDDF